MGLNSKGLGSNNSAAGVAQALKDPDEVLSLIDIADGEVLQRQGDKIGGIAAPPPGAHALGGAAHTPDTLANLNSKVSDATLIDTADARLSDARTPTAHALGGAEHSADTLANLNSKVSDATLDDSSATRDPNAHTHPESDIDLDAAASGVVVGKQASGAGPATEFGPGAGSNQVLMELGGAGSLFFSRIKNPNIDIAAAISNDKLANMVADRIKGRISTTGAPQDLTAAQVKTILALDFSDLTGQAATAQIADDAVTDPKLRNSAALSVIGRSVNSAGDPADIAAAANKILARAGDNLLAFQEVATAMIADDAVTNPKLANMAQGRVKGRGATSGTGDPQDLTAAQIKTILALVHADLAGVGFDDHKTVTTTSTTDGVAKTIETIAVADDTVVEIVAEIVGRRTNGADRIGGIVRATVFREATAGVVVEGVSQDFAASDGNYDIDIVESGNNALIQVTGQTAHNLNWRSVSKLNSVS